jgi:hypothetical protein
MNKFYEHKIKHYQIVNHYGGNPKKVTPPHKLVDEQKYVKYSDEEGEEYKDWVTFGEERDQDNKGYLSMTIWRAFELKNLVEEIKIYERALFLNSEWTLEIIINMLDSLYYRDDKLPLKDIKGLLLMTDRLVSNYYHEKLELKDVGIEILNFLNDKMDINDILEANLFLANVYTDDTEIKKNVCRAVEILEKTLSEIDINDIEKIQYEDTAKYLRVLKKFNKIKNKLYNIKNNIIYTMRERIIKKYILKCLTGYEYNAAKVKYLGDWETNVRYKKIKIKPLEISEINYYFSYNNDYEVMYNSVIKDGCLLKYGSDNIKNNKSIVLSAVNQNGLALEYASDYLKEDKEIILKAVGNNGMIIENILIEKKKKSIHMIINDHDIFRVAIQSNGLSLKFASDELKDSMEIVEKAVIQNGLALQYASDRLKDNKIIVNTAIKQNGLALQYASDRLKSRVKIIIRAVKQNGLALQYVPEYIKTRAIEITGVAIRNNISAINYSTIKLNDLPRVSFLIYNYNVELIKYVDYDIKNNYDVILYCVKQNGLLLEFASEKLKMNKDIVIAAIKQNLLAYKFIGSDFYYNDTKFIFYLFFKQRNLIFLLKDYAHPYHRTFNKVDEDYPIHIKSDYAYNDKFFSHLYSILLNINIINIPYELTEKIKKDIDIDIQFTLFPFFTNDSIEIGHGIHFKNAITDNYYIKTYFKLMMKCCLKVSNYYENSCNKNEAILNVKNYPLLQPNLYYRYIGLIKILKDTVLSKSGLLKLLLKKICSVLNNEKKSKMIHNLIIKSSINRKMLNQKFRIIKNSNYYNSIYPEFDDT